MESTGDFASLLSELERVVKELESDIPIEKAIELFEHGIKLSSDCERFLNSAEQKIEILKKSASGEITLELLQSELLDISGSQAIL